MRATIIFSLVFGECTVVYFFVSVTRSTILMVSTFLSPHVVLIFPHLIIDGHTLYSYCQITEYPCYLAIIFSHAFKLFSKPRFIAPSVSWLLSIAFSWSYFRVFFKGVVSLVWQIVAVSDLLRASLRCFVNTRAVRVNAWKRHAHLFIRMVHNCAVCVGSNRKNVY